VSDDERRRRFERLNLWADKVTRTDARFFRRHPERRHLLRRADRADIEINRLLGVRYEIALCPGRTVYALVKQIADGVRARFFVLGWERLPSYDEEVVAIMFELLLSGAGDSKSSSATGRCGT